MKINPPFTLLPILSFFCFAIFSLVPHPGFGQEQQDHYEYAIRFAGAGQISYFSPYDNNFEGKHSISGYSFAVEASRWISPSWDIGIGYHISNQVGNTEAFDCLRIGPNPCPQKRGKVNYMKIPISFGWYGIQKKRYSSKITLGPQVQLLLSQPYYGRPDYKKFTLGIASDWVNYFVINKQFDFVAGLRYDQSLTNADETRDKSRIKSIAIHVGINCNL